MTTRTERLAKVREIINQIRVDAENDVAKHDGRLMEGQRMGQIHGELNGLIVGLANCIEQLALDEPATVREQAQVAAHAVVDGYARVTGRPAGAAGIAYTGPGYGVGTVIRHSRKLDHAPEGTIIYNSGNLAHIISSPGEGSQFFIRVAGSWHPCTDAGDLRVLPDFPDGFASDQVFLPARVWAVAP